jgi:hypothetical protein
MKRLFSTLLLLCGGLAAWGQITLTQANCQFAPPPAVDTFFELPLTVPRLLSGAGQVWDLSGFAPTGGVVYEYGLPEQSAFPKATLGQKAVTPFSQLSYTQFNQKGVEPGGWIEYGQALERQSLPIGALTGNSLDSLIFPKQTTTYAGRFRLYQLPLTMGTAWKDTFRLALKFNLTVTAFGLNKVPGERRSVWAIDQRAVAWGSMTVRNRAGLKSDPHQVLCIRSAQVIRDSFFLAGLPAPAALLTAFGLQQGQIDRVYEEIYVRPNEASPLCYTEFSDAAFSNMSDIYTHFERVGGPTSSVPEAFAIGLRMYPNPVAAGQALRLDLGEQTGDFRLEVLDALGRRVLAQNVAASADLPTLGWAPGPYFYRLSDSAGRTAASGRVAVE